MDHRDNTLDLTDLPKEKKAALPVHMHCSMLTEAYGFYESTTKNLLLTTNL
jgi:hypothetical protein